MQAVVDVVMWLVGHYDAIILNLLAILGALLAFFMVIPGEQPDRALQSVVDFIKRFSKK